MRFLKLYEEWKSVNSFINESLSTARTRFLDTEKVTEEEFEEALGFDLSTNKKYIEKILDFYLKGKNEYEESIQQIGVTIKRFDTLVNRNKIAKTDINYFKTYKIFTVAILDHWLNFLRRFKKNKSFFAFFAFVNVVNFGFNHSKFFSRILNFIFKLI